MYILILLLLSWTICCMLVCLDFWILWTVSLKASIYKFSDDFNVVEDCLGSPLINTSGPNKNKNCTQETLNLFICPNSSTNSTTYRLNWPRGQISEKQFRMWTQIKVGGKKARSILQVLRTDTGQKKPVKYVV